MMPRPTVARVRGILAEGVDEAKTIVLDAIKQQQTPGEQWVLPIIEILPSCYSDEGFEALVDFPVLPECFSSLRTGSMNYTIGKLVFNCSFDDGLTQLYPHDSHPILDLIFVTGVGGHAYGSWASKEHPWEMWPRHFLCKEFRNVRTMIFGYKMKLDKLGYAMLDDYATRLQASIHSMRYNNDSARPLAFVSHSFGGNIVKSCLLKDSTILNMTKAIMFFAVPHKGMDIEDMVSSLGATSESPTAIHEINDWKNLTKQFINNTGHIQFSSIYETQPTRRLVKTISGGFERSGPPVALVSTESATLGLPKTMEVTYSVAQDHSSIVKFNHCYDETFRFIKRRLEEVVSNIQTLSTQHKPQPLTENEERLAHDVQGPTGNFHFGSVVQRPHLAHLQYSQGPSTSIDLVSQDQEHKRRLIKVLPKLGKLFGRQGLLDELDDLIILNGKRPYEKHINTLYGLTGSGKTHLALEWVKRQLSTEPHRKIYWMKGHSQEVFENSVGLMFPHHNSLYKDNDRVISADLRSNRIIDSFLAELNSSKNTGWVMVIDNAVEWRLNANQGVSPTFTIQEIVDNLTQGVIIITTNQQNLAIDGYNKLKVGALDPDASLKYLKASISHYVPKEEELQKLGLSLRHLPMSLKLACSAMRARSLTIAEYLKKHTTVYDSSENVLLESMRACFADLEIRNKLAVEVLKLYGFLEHSNFSSSILLGPNARKGYYSGKYPKWFFDITNDTWDSIKEDLSNIFFVEVVGDRRGIPPSVHQFARNQAGNKRSDYILLAISLVAANVPQSEEAGSWETSKQLLPHAEQCWKYLHEAETLRQEDLAQFGNLFRQAGRYSEAVDMYGTVIASLSNLQSVRDEDTEFLASMFNNIGLAFLGNRDYEHATIAFNSSKEWRKSIRGFKDSYNALYNTGLVEKALGRLESAEQMFLHAEKLLDHEDNRQRLGQITLERYKIQNNLGEVKLEQGYYDEARKCFETVRINLEAQYEKEQIERAELEQALYYGSYLKAVSSEASYPKLIFARLNLAKVSIRQGMLPNAIDELDGIIKSCIKAWGDNHPQSIDIYTEVAIWYLEYGQRKNQVKLRSGDNSLEAAAKLCIHVKEFYQSRYGNYSDLTLRIELISGIVQSAMDHSREAERIISRVIKGHKIREINIRHTSDSDTEWMLDAHIHLALVLADQNKYQEATKTLSYIIDRYETPPPLFRQRLLYNKAIFFKAMVLLGDGYIEEASRILHELSTTEGVGCKEWQKLASQELDKMSQPTLVDETTDSSDAMPEPIRFSLRFQNIPASWLS